MAGALADNFIAQIGAVDKETFQSFSRLKLILFCFCKLLIHVENVLNPTNYQTIKNDLLDIMTELNILQKVEDNLM